MSPLDRIANVSTLKVHILLPMHLVREVQVHRITFRFLLLLLFLKQHEVDKLYKVEYKPIVSTSDQ